MIADGIEEITPHQFDASWGDRGQVYDANGRRLDLLCRWNTRTGEVTRYVRDENGGIVTTHGGWVIATVTERHPAPLTFVPA